jgi:hypothetical protein
MFADERHQLHAIDKPVPLLVAAFFVVILIPQTNVQDAMPRETPHKIPVAVEHATRYLPGNRVRQSSWRHGATTGNNLEVAPAPEPAIATAEAVVLSAVRSPVASLSLSGAGFV